MSVMKKIKFVLVMFIPLAAIVAIVFIIKYAIELNKGKIPEPVEQGLMIPYLEAVKAGKTYDAYYGLTTDNYKAQFDYTRYEDGIKLKWKASYKVEFDRVEPVAQGNKKFLRIYYKRFDAQDLPKEAAIYDVIEVEGKWKIDKSYTQDFNRIAPQPM